MDTELTKECIKYFKSNKGYSRLLNGIYEKYRSLGSLGGTVSLASLSPEEKQALSGLLKKDYYSSKSAHIKVEKVVLALNGTKFEHVDFEEVLQGIFGHELISKKDEKAIYMSKRDDFFKNILREYVDTKAYTWISQCLEGHNANRLLFLWYDRDKLSLAYSLRLSMDAINALNPGTHTFKRLAVFAANIAKNPHAFDSDSDMGRLLMYGIMSLLDVKSYPSSAEEKAELFYNVGLITDEVSNYTITSGLIAYASDGTIHKGWEGFYNSSEPLLATLWNVSLVDTIVSPNNTVFVFENPNVFSQVKTELRNLNVGLICTFGQVKLASLVVIDKLYQSGATVYYSGDFDPEGLLIADKLKKRYKNLVLWRYSYSDYMDCISDNTITSTRLKQLEKLEDEGLIAISKTLASIKKAGYQEMLIDKYVLDIQNLNSNPISI